MCIRAVVALFTLLILLVLLVLVPLLVNTYAGFRIAIGIYIIGTIFLSEPHNLKHVIDYLHYFGI